MNTESTPHVSSLNRGGRSISSLKQILLAFLALVGVVTAPVSAIGGTVSHGIAAGMIKVEQYPDWTLDPSAGDHNNTNVIATLIASINDFRLTTYNRADLSLQIGTSATDDLAGGMLISCISQNGTRNNWATNEVGTNLCSTSSFHPGANSYRIATAASPNLGAGSGYEYNSDVAGAWFPYSKYIGGWARNGVSPTGNTLTNDTVSGYPGLTVGTHYIDQKLTLNLSGRSVVDLRPFGVDSRTDGVLLVTHAKEEGNYVLSQANPANGTWTVFVKDNATATAGSYEQDPLGFVFVAKTNTSTIIGKFQGNGTIEMYSGSTPQFTVTNAGAGRWELQMIGYAATNGILIISPEGGRGQNLDNIVSYQVNPDGLGWQIQSRDTPANGLQTPGPGDEPIISFVFIPAPTPGFAVTPTENLLTSEGGGSANFEVSLHAQPTANVTVAVSSSNPAEGTVSTNELVFTAANWLTPQTVTVTGGDDGLSDGSVNYSIILGAAVSADSRYNGMNPPDVAAINADNELGITLNKNAASTTEDGGSNTFTVVLNTLPTADVTIGLSSSDLTEGTVSPASLTFSTADWNVPQTVTVTGVNDDVDDGDVAFSIVTAAATSTDGNYSGFNAADVTVINADNDTVGIVFTPAGGLAVNESGTSTNFTVVLASEPAANVTVNLASADAGEGSVTPSSRIFTPANWSTPQSFTLTGVNDGVNDGSVSYNLTGTVTSGDSLYAALVPSIGATTSDNEAALTLPSGTLLYGTGLPGVGIDGAATVSDPDTADYNGGSLTITLTVNGTSDDRIEIRNTGTGAGQIGVSGNNVSYEGVNIGTFSGGVGVSPLVVTLNGSANAVSAQALIRNVTFRNVNSAPSIALRTVSFALADGDGGISTASKNIKVGLLHISDFQEGADRGFGPYTGQVDIELNNLLADNNFPAGSDPVNGLVINNNNQTLLRFGNIVGGGAGQIPPNAIIVSADLYLDVNNAGLGGPLHLMLQSWDGTNDTWNSWGGAIDRDNIEATNTAYSQFGTFPTSGATTVGTILFSVLPDVQAWVNGEANHGWAMLPWDFATDNTIFSPSEATNIVDRPRLRVVWVPAGTAVATFRQGVDSYASARDTRLREAVPTENASALTNLFVDAEVNAGEADPEHILMRFDDIIGNGVSQIPAGATIHAASLDLASVIGNGMGDGGTIHAMLQPWSDTDTWDSLVSGVVANNVEAAATPTVTAGSASLNPDVQGGYLTFDVTADVQLWANGVRPNYGWALLPWPLGGNGWGFNSAEAEIVSNRPGLRVFYTPNVVNNLVMKTPVWTPTSVQINFTGTANETYYILRAPEVTGPWTTNGLATAGLNGNGSHTDNAPLPGRAFYQAYRP